MKIASLRAFRVQIPFKKKFKHSLRERSSTDNIIIEMRLKDGTVGYGEGLPRDYVTGETPEGVLAALEQLPKELFKWDFNTLEALLAFLDEEILSRKNFPHEKENNTARCVLELSFLDAYCKSLKKTFFDVTRLTLQDLTGFKKARVLYYDGVLSLDSWIPTVVSALKMKFFGFRRLKLKVSSDIEATVHMVDQVRKIVGNKIDLRIDANGAWTLDEACGISQCLVPYSISCIEQPLAHRDVSQTQEFRKRTQIPIMIDESLSSMEDARFAVEHKCCDLFNIRLSKCGGFINSLRLALFARQQGIGYQLGCMVGETAILSAAGRHFATYDPQLCYLEGSFDRYLLKDNMASRDMSFSWGGKALPVEGYGLGVEIDNQKLKRYAVYENLIYESHA